MYFFGRAPSPTPSNSSISDNESVLTNATTVVSNVSSAFALAHQEPLELESPLAQDSGVEDKEYPVEKILDCAEENGIRWYKVQWSTDNGKEAFWTEAQNLDCADLVEEYHREEEQRQSIKRSQEGTVKITNKRSEVDRGGDRGKKISLKRVKMEGTLSDESQDSGNGEFFKCPQLNCGRKFLTQRSLTCHKSYHTRRKRSLPVRGLMIKTKTNDTDDVSTRSNSVETVICSQVEQRSPPVIANNNPSENSVSSAAPWSPSTAISAPSTSIESTPDEPSSSTQQSPQETDAPSMDAPSTSSSSASPNGFLHQKPQVENKMDVKPNASEELCGLDTTKLNSWLRVSQRYVVGLQKREANLNLLLEKEKELRIEEVAERDARIKELEQQLSTKSEIVKELKTNLGEKDAKISELEKKEGKKRDLLRQLEHLIQSADN